MSSRLLHFEDISYTYPGSDRPAIQQLTLTIPAGQKSVILGHNGCGKSTLLLLADGLMRCDRGTIFWQDEPLKYNFQTLNRWRERMGLAFQDPEQQLVAGTVAEDISYGLCNLKLLPSEIAQRLQQALTDFSLQALANQPLHQLSLGQKRRVALAGVMALTPQLLLLDEPTAYLDGIQTRHLLQELDRIHVAGTTIVMATHDLDLAYAWADWMFVLHEGQLVLSCSMDEMLIHRTVMECFQLEIPLLLKVWDALPESLKAERPPRSVRELQLQLVDRKHS